VTTSTACRRRHTRRTCDRPRDFVSCCRCCCCSRCCLKKDSRRLRDVLLLPSSLSVRDCNFVTCCSCRSCCCRCCCCRRTGAPKRLATTRLRDVLLSLSSSSRDRTGTCPPRKSRDRPRDFDRHIVRWSVRSRRERHRTRYTDTLKHDDAVKATFHVTSFPATSPRRMSRGSCRLVSELSDVSGDKLSTG